MTGCNEVVPGAFWLYTSCTMANAKPFICLPVVGHSWPDGAPLAADITSDGINVVLIGVIVPVDDDVYI